MGKDLIYKQILSATTLLLRYFQRYLARACARGSSL